MESVLTPSFAPAKCALCEQEHRHSAPFNRCVDVGVEWRYFICRNCGLVYQSPQMNDAELARFYQADYWRTQGQGAAPDSEQVKLQMGRAKHLLSLVPQSHRVQRYLDIGCAAGFALREGRRQFGGQVVGIEPSDTFREFCSADGLSVYASVETLIEAGELPFDCVSLSHVLEHVRDPVEFLKRIRNDLLNPDGILALEVPNLYGHSTFEAAHPICFNEMTLRATLAKAGYTTSTVAIHNHPRTEIARPLYIAAVATPGSSDVQFAAPNVWLERVKRAYTYKRGGWCRRAWKAARVGLRALVSSDFRY